MEKRHSSGVRGEPRRRAGVWRGRRHARRDATIANFSALLKAEALRSQAEIPRRRAHVRPPRTRIARSDL